MPAAKLDQHPFGGWHHTNDHGWLFKRSPRFADGIYREAGSFLRTPFTEGCSWVFGLGFIGYHFLSSIITFKVQFSSVLIVLYLPSVHVGLRWGFLLR